MCDCSKESILVCFEQSMASRSKEVIPPRLFSTGKTHLWCCVLPWVLQYKESMDVLERVQGTVLNVIKGFEYLTYGERPREHLITVYPTWEGSKEDGEIHLSCVLCLRWA